MKSLEKLEEISNGKVAAAIISASLGLILIGIMTYSRNMEPVKAFVNIWSPIAAVGGIWLYGYLSWIISWGILYALLRKKNKIANMKVWLIVFFISLGICTGLIEGSLDWPPLF